LALNALTVPDSGLYRCVVDDDGTDVQTSTSAILMVYDHVAITTQPAGGDFYAGDALTLTVAASGGMGALHYQWQKGGVDIPGATADSLTLNPLAPADAGTYRCVVDDDLTDVVPSSDATVTVATHVSITTQPVGATLAVGASHTFTVVAADGQGTLHYQWQKDGVDVPGATASSLALASLTAGDSGVYRCVVTDDGTDSVPSDDATLTVYDALRIATQPAGATVTEGDSHTFTVVAADGQPPYSYQWRKGGVAIAGATSASLTLDDLTAGDSGAYSCIVTDQADSVTSNVAQLRVDLLTSMPAAGAFGLALMGMASALAAVRKLRRRA
jgi:hypothetical protein